MNIKEFPCLDLLDLSYQEMIEIYDSLNKWEWHELLGKKPNWWDKSLSKEKSKHINSTMKTIGMITSKKDRLMYHHINNLDRTKTQFYHWWYVERRAPDWLSNWIFNIKNRE